MQLLPQDQVRHLSCIWPGSRLVAELRELYHPTFLGNLLFTLNKSLHAPTSSTRKMEITVVQRILLGFFSFLVKVLNRYCVKQMLPSVFSLGLFFYQYTLVLTSRGVSSCASGLTSPARTHIVCKHRLKLFESDVILLDGSERETPPSLSPTFLFPQALPIFFFKAQRMNADVLWPPCLKQFMRQGSLKDQLDVLDFFRQRTSHF